MTEVSQVKPFQEYDELIRILYERGMKFRDPIRAQRKLTQVGYYRLSGYWHTSRCFQHVEGKIQYENRFQRGTLFENVFEFYLFDKKLRLEVINALERIEIYLRTIIAHEIGRLDPLAYLDKQQFSRDAFKPDAKISYEAWLYRHEKLISESKEESIVHHKSNQKQIPIWVAAEAWDFGALTKFYSILRGSNQDLICNRIGLDSRKILENWLINLNGIRNRCAHHSRLCNRSNPRTLSIPRNGYFNLLNLEEPQKNKFYGVITIMWFLLKKIGPNSRWLYRVSELLNNLPNVPGFTYRSMGLPETGIPKHLINDNKIHAELFAISDISSLTKTLRKIISEIDKNTLSAQDQDYIEKKSYELMDIAYLMDEIKKET